MFDFNGMSFLVPVLTGVTDFSLVGCPGIYREYSYKLRFRCTRSVVLEFTSRLMRLSTPIMPRSKCLVDYSYPSLGSSRK